MKKGMVSILSGMAGMAAGTVFGAMVAKKAFAKEIGKWREMSERHLTLFLLMNQWIKDKQEGRELAVFLMDNHLNNIAVYGMSYIGETLVNELKGSGIRVSYCIDKNAESIDSDIEIYSPQDELPAVDAVIVTAVTFFDEIRETLKEKINCPVFSLKDILYR